MIPLSLQSSFFITLSIFVVGALGALAVNRNALLANIVSHTAALLGSLFGLFTGISALLTHTAFRLNIASPLPLLSYTFSVDGLSAFFIAVISLIGAIASIYAFDYVRHYEGKYNLGVLGFFYNLFIASMLLVVSTGNLLFFLVAWEVMSLTSYFLVIYEHKDPSVVAAGTLYFIMTHAGTACLTLAVLLLYAATGSFDFAVIRQTAGHIPLLTRDAIFFLTLIGLGTKSGIIPLHIWLPSAHPAAPTHVSALMSGVMIKTGIYMMVRLYMDLLPAGPVFWGLTVLGIGAISSVLGVLYALTEHDIKKLLAYHSIENIGIILLGLGSAMIFSSLGMKEFAILALTAALFHTLNHATFKALLFLGAGAVISKTHTRNIEEYGGLIKRMPYTAFFFLIGALAISALPPFNGFASEWMTFQSLFAGMRTIHTSAMWAFVAAAASLAITGGLAAACFVKAFGATFLARPRSIHAEHATEVPQTMTVAMGILAALTLIIGVCASSITGTIFTAGFGWMHQLTNANAAYYQEPMIVALRDGFAALRMPAVFLEIATAILLTYVLISTVTKNRKVTIVETWDCGTTLTPRMEITATGFSRSIITIFKGILRPSKQLDVEYHDADMRYFTKSNRVTLTIADPYRTVLYRPVAATLYKLSHMIKKIQIGPINTYVLYMFVALLILLATLSIR